MKSFLEYPRIYKQLLAAAADFLLLPLTFGLAVFLRYDQHTMQLFYMYFWIAISAPLISIPIFLKLGLYRAVIPFIDQKIVYVVGLGVTLSVICMAALATFLHTTSLSSDGKSVV